MAVKSDLQNYTAYSVLRTIKISADPRNTSYTYALEGEKHFGIPDINWDKVLFIADKKWIWTHGTIYDCSRGMVILSQAEYDAIRRIDMSTIYLIQENDEIVKIYFGSVPVITESAIAALFQILEKKIEEQAKQISALQELVTGGVFPKLTQSEYDALQFSQMIVNRFYTIYDDEDDSKLRRIYLGETMIWEATPTMDGVSAFPQILPFIFS